MINTIENAITAVLKDVFKEFQVDSFPVDFQKFAFLSPKGCILVRFENSVVSARQSVTAVNTEETYNFTIFAAMRYVQKHSDTYSFLQDIKRTLNGLNIMNKRLVYTKRNFENEINGDLWYSFECEITFPVKDEYKDISAAADVFLQAVNN